MAAGRNGGRPQGQTLLSGRPARTCVEHSTDSSVAVRATGLGDRMLPGAAKGEPFPSRQPVLSLQSLLSPQLRH